MLGSVKSELIELYDIGSGTWETLSTRLPEQTEFSLGTGFIHQGRFFLFGNKNWIEGIGQDAKLCFWFKRPAWSPWDRLQIYGPTISSKGPWKRGTRATAP